MPIAIYRGDKHAVEDENESVSGFFVCLVLLTAVHLKLGGWKVDVHNHFRAGMFHLQTRIQLQEVEPSILREEVFHSPCAHVAHHLGQRHGKLGRRKKSNEKCSSSAGRVGDTNAS